MLDDRKLAILTEIVDYYIKSAEPIGSRTLSKKPEIGLSSATIRNEMSDLEELGYLMKTHISSGRIPSNKAYRLYVNHILEDGIKRNDKFIESLKSNLINESSSLKNYYETANKMLSQETSYITVILSPIANSYTIEYMKLELLSSKSLLVIFVGQHGENSSYIFNNFMLQEGIDISELENYSKKLILNKTKGELKETILDLTSDYPNKEFFVQLINMALEFLEKQDSYNVFLNGIGNIFGWTEENDLKSLIDFIEEDKNLIDVSIRSSIEEILDIKIGNENEDEILHNSSIMTSSYTTEFGDSGNITLIGPTRMDYRKLANILYNFSALLSGFK